MPPGRGDGLRLRLRGLFLVGLDGAQASRLPAQLAEIIKLGAAYTAGPHHFNLVDYGRVQGEDSLHPRAERDLADGKGGMIAGAAKTDHRAFEDLDSLLFAFFDLDVHLHRITGAKR